MNGKIPSMTEIALVTDRNKLDEFEAPADVDAAVVVRSHGQTIVFSVETLRKIVAQYDATRP